MEKESIIREHEGNTNILYMYMYYNRDISFRLYYMVTVITTIFNR